MASWPDKRWAADEAAKKAHGSAHHADTPLMLTAMASSRSVEATLLGFCQLPTLVSMSSLCVYVRHAFATHTALLAPWSSPVFPALADDTRVRACAKLPVERPSGNLFFSFEWMAAFWTCELCRTALRAGLAIGEISPTTCKSAFLPCPEYACSCSSPNRCRWTANPAPRQHKLVQQDLSVDSMSQKDAALLQSVPYHLRKPFAYCSTVNTDGTRNELGHPVYMIQAPGASNAFQRDGERLESQRGDITVEAIVRFPPGLKHVRHRAGYFFPLVSTHGSGFGWELRLSPQGGLGFLTSPRQKHWTGHAEHMAQLPAGIDLTYWTHIAVVCAVSRVDCSMTYAFYAGGECIDTWSSSPDFDCPSKRHNVQGYNQVSAKRNMFVLRKCAHTCAPCSACTQC